MAGEEAGAFGEERIGAVAEQAGWAEAAGQDVGEVGVWHFGPVVAGCVAAEFEVVSARDEGDVGESVRVEGELVSCCNVFG